MRIILVLFMKILLGLFIFAGLPFLLTGLGFESFFSSPARTVYVISVLVLQIAVISVIPNPGGDKPNTSGLNSVQIATLRVLQILPLLAVLSAGISDGYNFAALDESENLRFAGVAIFVLGFGLMHWAEYALGKDFSVKVEIQENHKLVTSGPFKLIRHPRYIGIIIMLSGLSLVFRSLLGLVLTLALFVFLLVRIIDEEKALRDHFGDAWDKYSLKTKRLIPYIY